MFSYKTLLLAISLSAHLVAAAPFGGIQRREVPQGTLAHIELRLLELTAVIL